MPTPSVPPRDAPPDRAAERRRFRSTLVRVLLVQVVTLLALWLVQQRYTI
jgi:hypothetical protein